MSCIYMSVKRNVRSLSLCWQHRLADLAAARKKRKMEDAGMIKQSKYDKNKYVCIPKLCYNEEHYSNYTYQKM